MHWNPGLLLFKTLRGRLVFFACFATLPAFIFVVYVATNERASALQMAQVESLYVAGSASREHAYQVSGAQRLLERLSALKFKSDRENSLSLLLPAILSGFPQLANIGILAPDGTVLFSAVPPPADINMARIAAFQEALVSPDVTTGSYVLGPIVHRPILIIAKSIRDERGQPERVLFAALDLEWLDKLAKQAGLPTDSALLIIDRQGTILASSLSGKLHVPGGQMLKGALGLIGKSGGMAHCVTPDSISRLAVAIPLEGVGGLWVVVAAPEEKVYGAANAIFMRDVAVLTMLTLLAIISSLIATDFSVLKDIRVLAAATRRFGGGELQARAPIPAPHGEIRNLAISFNTMADALARQARQAVLAQGRLRALSHQLQYAREEESARIAQELHDELGQELSVMRLELDRLRRKLVVEQEVFGVEEFVSVIDRFGDSLDSAVRSVRRIASELRPGVLDRLGLEAGLEWLLNEFQRRTDIATSLATNGHRHWDDAGVSTALFRITQEALTNIARHAHATSVNTRLAFSDQEVTLVITDNGKGYLPGDEDSKVSLGLLGMRERAGRLGGTLTIHSAPGEGTELHVTIPRGSVATPSHMG